MSRIAFRLLTGAALAFGATSAQPQGTYQRLTTQFLGQNMSLSIENTGRNDVKQSTAMHQSANVDQQFWLFWQQPNGNYRLTNRHRGTNRCLDVAPGGILYFDKCGMQIGQQWNAQQLPGGGLRLVNAMMPGHCLDVMNNPGAYLVYLAPCNGAMGQVWFAGDTGLRP